MNPQLWWYVARATGVVAWALSVASLLWGLALSSRATARKPGPAWLLDLHRHLGGLTLLFVLAHMGALVADSYAYFGMRELLVPFAATWRPGPVAFGVVGFWLLAAIEVSSLAKRRLPASWWRAVHATSYLAAGAATAHLVASGTDASNPGLRWGPAIATAAAAFFLTYRLLVPRRAAARGA